MFLLDGSADGRVVCELLNWTGKAYKIPRHLLRTSSERVDLYRAGVYFLFGRDETTNEIAITYVGEAEEIYPRLQQHQDKEFWNEALIFVSKDENLNKAHIKFLEHTIHQAAMTAGRYRLENSNTPNRPAISEVEMAVMSEFFDQLRLLTGALGYKVFEPLVASRTQAVFDRKEEQQPASSAEVPTVREFHISGARRAEACAIITAEGVVVLEGSFAAADEVESTPDSTRRLRAKLVEEGALVLQDSRYRFERDVLFATPSSAASVVLGRSANGRIELVDEAGRTLKELEEAPRLVNPPAAADY
ncbi:GIY-YIG nuclease family protein [Candidatus Manganitrophus noduliformans]|nr:GIY-YIG nuclease family protein [Candidatus Manganitrophus noduliformans]